VKKYLLLALALAFAAIYLFPVYWMYATALKSSGAIFKFPPELWPSEPEVQVARVFAEHDIGRYLWNSLLVATGITAITVVLGTGAAYALANARGAKANVALFLIIVLQVLPPSLMVTPLFVAFNQVGLLAWPRSAVVLATAAKTLAFYVVLCRATFTQVPRELRDAALVDGNSHLGAFFMIILPIARNGILITSVLVFLQSFGEYVYSRSFIAAKELQTATVNLASYLSANSADWVGLMNYAGIYVAPILVVFILLQRQIVTGLTSGALK
jgi:multiple sugar transport system permease protein